MIVDLKILEAQVYIQTTLDSRICPSIRENKNEVLKPETQRNRLTYRFRRRAKDPLRFGTGESGRKRESKRNQDT